LSLPAQGQINATGDESLRRQPSWMITLDDRLDDLRREKGEPDEPAHIVFGQTFAFPMPAIEDTRPVNRSSNQRCARAMAFRRAGSAF
jgi:hypothetical protein